MSRSTVQSATRKKQLAENQGKSGEIECEGYATEQFITRTPPSGTSSTSITSGTSGTSVYIMASPSPEPPVSKEQIRDSIWAHIQAIRTLGRTQINTQEIADALSISVQEVNDALEALKEHGVRRR
jgi:biotin operon repressor